MGFITSIGSMYKRENDGIFELQRITPHLFSQNATRKSDLPHATTVSVIGLSHLKHIKMMS